MLRLELCKFTQSVLNIVAVAPLPRSASNAFVGGGRGGGGRAAGSSGRRGGGDATAAAGTAGDADDTTEESCFPLELAEARARATTVPKDCSFLRRNSHPTSRDSRPCAMIDDHRMVVLRR
jgi:hypothetical protein